MKCPVDDATLVMSERQGVEIDYCPTCRGVWLDRGELDKIIDRADSDDDDRRPEGRADARRDRGGYDGDRGGYDLDRHAHVPGQPYRKKRKSFLGEMFEFGD
jgi:Zn-finger nucleic acid-binding protein